jgi:hypothetical protein
LLPPPTNNVGCCQSQPETFGATVQANSPAILADPTSAVPAVRVRFGSIQVKGRDARNTRTAREKRDAMPDPGPRVDRPSARTLACTCSRLGRAAGSFASCLDRVGFVRLRGRHDRPCDPGAPGTNRRACAMGWYRLRTEKRSHSSLRGPSLLIPDIRAPMLARALPFPCVAIGSFRSIGGCRDSVTTLLTSQ